MTAETAAVLEISDLRVNLESGAPVVEGVSLAVQAGEILGLIGESGSGKSTTARALLGYSRAGLRIAEGSISVAGTEADLQDEGATSGLRGRSLAYVPQDPNSALNPARRIRNLILDMIDAHGVADKGSNSTPEAALERVHLPGSADFARRYPHELSGGQQQRVTLSIALVCEPPLVILDEPTTGLDVITQARILTEIDRLRRERNLGIIYITHDVAVVASIADRIAVMYAGRVVEQGPTARLLNAAAHPYTRALIAATPDHLAPKTLQGLPGVAVGVTERPVGCPFAPRCPQRVERCTVEMPALETIGSDHEVRCPEWRRTEPAVRMPPRRRSARNGGETPLLAVENLRAVHAGRDGEVVAAADVSFDLERGECLALVGESGSGKTTIARCVAGLHRPVAGRIALEGAPLAPRAKDRPRELRRRCQIVFQNPYDSLNPRDRVEDAIARPLRALRGLTRSEARAEVVELLDSVQLPARLGGCYPAELSGGERQRVAIARALGAKPDLLVCDEITSALDVSVQAAVLEILADLRAELGLAMLFITHNLAVVASIADDVLVLEQGRICERGPAEVVFANPKHPYTRQLLDAAPRLQAREELID